MCVPVCVFFDVIEEQSIYNMMKDKIVLLLNMNDFGYVCLFK